MKQKYHVQIPTDYLEMKYPDWPAYTQERKVALQHELFNEIDAFLSGRSSANTIFTSYSRLNEAIKITPLSPARPLRRSPVAERIARIREKREERRKLRYEKWLENLFQTSPQPPSSGGEGSEGRSVI